MLSGCYEFELRSANPTAILPTRLLCQSNCRSLRKQALALRLKPDCKRSRKPNLYSVFGSSPAPVQNSPSHKR